MNHMCTYLVLGFDGTVAILDNCPVCGSAADEIEGCCRPVNEPPFADTEAAWEAEEDAALEAADLL